MTRQRTLRVCRATASGDRFRGQDSRNTGAVRLRALSAAVLLVALLCVSAGARPASSPEARLTGILRTTYFTVHHDPSDPVLASLTADTAQDELLRISRRLGYVPEKGKPVPVYVYRTHHDFIRAGGKDVRKFTVGTARGDQRIAIDASGAFVSTREVLAHEIAHVVVFRTLGASAAALPLWVNEGLAVYLSQDYDPGDLTIANAAASGTLIPLDDLARDFPEGRTDLAYAESASAIRYMVKTYGQPAPRKLLAELARTGSFERAIKAATGRSREQFVSDWQGHVSRGYAGIRLVKIVGALIGTLMALLAVAAFLVRRKQKIEAARRWEMEEFDERMNRQLRDWWR